MPSATPEQALQILIADEDHDALALTIESLERLGHRVSGAAVNLEEISEAVARDSPDVAVVVEHDDESHALELVEQIASISGAPVIIATHRHDPDLAKEAADRGVFACIASEGPEALQTAIEVTMRRHREVARREEQVDQLQGALERRALIERAKGILMERHDIDDSDAFERMRRFARSNHHTIIDVARSVCDRKDLPPAS